MDGERSELRQGWKIVLALHLSCAFGVAILLPFSLGVFVGPLSSEMGWTRQQISVGLSIFAIGILPMSLLVGALTDRFGVRRVLLISQVGLSLCFMLYALMTSLWHFYAISALLPLLGAGTLIITSSKAINAQFTRQRGLALGLMLAGSGVGGFIIPMLAASVQQAATWRVAFVALALLPLLVFPAAFAWVRPDQGRGPARAQELTHGATLREALGSYRFWIIAVAFFSGSFGLMGVLSSLIPILTSGGMSPIYAASMMSLFAVAMVVGRLSTGFALDRIWAPYVGAMLCLPAALALFFWGSLGNAAIPAMVVLIGLATGSEYDLSAYMISKYFGVRHYGKIYAAVYAAFAAGGALSPPLYAWVHATQGSYALGLFASAVGFLITALLPLLLGRYPRV